MNSYADILGRYRDENDQTLCDVVRYQDDYTEDAIEVAKTLLTERGVDFPDNQGSKTNNKKKASPRLTVDKLIGRILRTTIRLAIGVSLATLLAILFDPDDIGIYAFARCIPYGIASPTFFLNAMAYSGAGDAGGLAIVKSGVLTLAFYAPFIGPKLIDKCCMTIGSIPSIREESKNNDDLY